MQRKGENSHAWGSMEGEGKGSHAWGSMEGEEKYFSPLPTFPLTNFI
jgi:hypothetical protein